MAVSVGLVKLHTSKIRSNIESSTVSVYCRNLSFIRLESICLLLSCTTETFNCVLHVCVHVHSIQ